MVKMLKLVCIHQSYHKIETGVSLFWNTLYNAFTIWKSCLSYKTSFSLLIFIYKNMHKMYVSIIYEFHFQGTWPGVKFWKNGLLKMMKITLYKRVIFVL